MTGENGGLTGETIEIPQQIKHNWLYSVLPVTKRLRRYSFPDVDEDALFLTGYCRNCDQAFSVEIPYILDNSVEYIITSPLLLTKMNIPKWGCSLPDIQGS